MTDYYVDSNAAGGGNGSYATPWNTLAAAEAALTGNQSGNSLRLKRESLFREGFQSGAWGTADSDAGRFKITDYGDGNLPKIYGSTKVITWSLHSGNIWSASLGTKPASLWVVLPDGGGIVWCEDKGTHDNCTDEFDWAHESGVIYLNAEGDPDTYYESVEAPTRWYGVHINNRNYLTVSYLDISFQYASGFESSGVFNQSPNTLYPTVEYCRCHHVGELNAQQGNGVCFRNVQYAKLRHNEFYHNARRGCVFWAEGSSGNVCAHNLAEYNKIYNCYHAAMDNFGETTGGLNDITLRKNFIYTDVNYNQGYPTLLPMHGILFQGGPSNPAATNGKFYDNIVILLHQDPALMTRKCNGVEFYNNTVYGYVSPGTDVTGICINDDYGASANVKIKNNLLIGLASRSLVVDVKTEVTECDYNLFYQPGGEPLVTIATTDYHANDQAAYLAATTGWRGGSGTSHDQWGVNPNLVNPGGLLASAYKLQSGSPGINTGLNLYSAGVVDDYDDVARPSGSEPFDMGAYEYQEGQTESRKMIWS